MPKRSTIAYSSEDFRLNNKDTTTTKDGLRTHYCHVCSNPTLITDANLAALPRRRGDQSTVLDRTTRVCRLRAKRSDEITAIRRKGSDVVEKQTRYYCGECKVPVCYECNEEKGTLYVFEGALRSFERKRGNNSTGRKKRKIDTTGTTSEEEEQPVPPCIRRGKGGKKVIVSVRVTEGQEKCAVMDICAERILISTTKENSKDCEREVLEFLSDAFKCRVAQLCVLVNEEEEDAAAKEIACDAESMSPESIFRALVKSRAASSS